MKVAIIVAEGFPVPAVKGGAIETLVESIAKQNEIFNKLEITIYSLYDEEAKKEALKYDNVEFVFVGRNKLLYSIKRKINALIRRIRKIDSNYTYINSIKKDIKSKDFDKIIVEGSIEYAIPLAKVVDKNKIYLHIHHNAFRYKHLNMDEILESSNKVISVSNYIKKETLKNIGINKNEVCVLKNCTNTNKFNINNNKDEVKKLKSKYGINQESIVILFSGRLIPDKGVKELILAFKQLCTEYDIVLLIVGNAGFGKSIRTKYDEELQEICKGIEDKIIFTGYIHNSLLPMIHAISDISVVPSIWNEPAGLVVIEAMASGLPLIVTDSGGIAEYITPECAIVVKRDKDIVINLKESLENLIKNPEIRKSMGYNGNKHAQKFNENTFYNDFISILKK